MSLLLIAAVPMLSFTVTIDPTVIVVDGTRGRTEYEEPRSARIDASGARKIVIEAKAGWLRVEGKTGTEVRAEGTAVAPTKSMLKEITLTAERDGDMVRITVKIPETRDDWQDWDNGPRLDLGIAVPASIPLEITDTSGEVEVRGVAALDIDDNSGALDLRDIGGALTVEDNSGEIEIVNVRGDVSIRDGSGEIDIRDVTGSVVVENDGSGEIVARNVSGTVHVRNDGSGSIRVDDVGGDFRVDRDGSGEVRYQNVKGTVRIPPERSRSRYRYRDGDKDRNGGRW